MHIPDLEKVYFRSQILERPSIGEYWNISGVPVLPENVIFMFFRTCWCYSEAYNTGTQKMVWYCPILVYQYLGLEVYFFPRFIYSCWIFAQGWFLKTAEELLCQV